MKPSNFSFWDAVLEDSAKEAKREKDITKTQGQRMRLWLMAKYTNDKDEGTTPLERTAPLRRRGHDFTGK